MEKNRLEAFSDGVIAIIITIMVLQFKVPLTGDIYALKPLIPMFVGYVLSFTFVGIYWNNHHHLFQAVKSVNGSVLWANLLLLFWLSIIPFVTEWMGDTGFGKWPVILYGIDLIFAAIAYAVLVKVLVRHHGADSLLAEAFGSDKKGKVTIVLYMAAIGLCFINSLIGFALYTFVAALWFVPDKRIESRIIKKQKTNN